MMKRHKPKTVQGTIKQPISGSKTVKEKQIANGRALSLNSMAWKRLRAYQLNLFPLCEYCSLYGLSVPATDVDHIDNNPSNNCLDNLQSLCKPCHSRKTNQDMGNSISYGCDENGYPLDPKHEWNGR